MPRTTETAGTCNGCGAAFTKRQMHAHLSKCAYPETRNFAAVTQIRVDAPGSPFWLDVDVKENAPLRDLDEFLRVMWLECCDHLSSFEIGGTYYGNVVTDHLSGERSMDARVSASLPPPGTTFEYEYDFGSTTQLRLKVVAKRNAPSRRESVRLLARNEDPVWKCSECGQPASALCRDCMYERDAFLCGAHGEDHECGEEAILPVVNSPRMGVCGYDGG